MSHAAALQRTYDRIAHQYDDLWSRHVGKPQARLTEALRLTRGERVADLACGTGVDTLEMQRRVAPCPVVGVDCSPGMLKGAAARAAAAGFELQTVVAGLDDFIVGAAPASFDVLSLRFCLAYFDWRAQLPKMVSLLRPKGRLGILTSLSSSVPQAWNTYVALAEEAGFPRTTPLIPDRPEDLTSALEAQGLKIERHFEDHFRLWFDTGGAATAWLLDSGYGSHPSTDELPKEAIPELLALFGKRMEVYREPRGVPLDFDLIGVVATPV